MPPAIAPENLIPMAAGSHREAAGFLKPTGLAEAWQFGELVG